MSVSLTNLHFLPEDSLQTEMMVGVHVTDVDHPQFFKHTTCSLWSESPTKLTKRALTAIKQDTAKTGYVEVCRRYITVL